MKKINLYPIAILLIIPLLLGLSGCAHRPQVKAPLFPKFTGAELGTIAVVSACFEPEFKCPHKPLKKGKAVGVGAWKGFLGAIDQDGGDGNTLALGIALSPIFAAGGALYGAIEGETTKTIMKAEETLNHCLNGLRVQEVMQEKVLSLAQKRSQCTYVLLDQCSPNPLDEEIRYGSLKEKGIDTVLQVNVLEFGLWREKDAINPPLSFLMAVSIGLIRVKDDALLSSHTFRYESKEKRKFIKWAEKDAQPLKEEFDRACETLAKEIVEELFLPIKEPEQKNQIHRSTTEPI